MSYNFLFSSGIWNNLRTKDFSNDTSLVFRSSLIIFLSVIVIPFLLPRRVARGQISYETGLVSSAVLWLQISQKPHTKQPKDTKENETRKRKQIKATKRRMTPVQKFPYFLKLNPLHIPRYLAQLSLVPAPVEVESEATGIVSWPGGRT